jgi:hypothetical protein
MLRKNPVLVACVLFLGWKSREIHRAAFSTDPSNDFPPHIKTPLKTGSSSDATAIPSFSYQQYPTRSTNSLSVSRAEAVDSKQISNNHTSDNFSSEFKTPKTDPLNEFKYPFTPDGGSGGVRSMKLGPRAIESELVVSTTKKIKCNEKIWEGNWPVHHRRMDNAVTICDGSVSKIKCVLGSDSGLVERSDYKSGGGDNDGPVARFCWVERLFAPSSAAAATAVNTTAAAGGGGGEGGKACSDDRFGRLDKEPAGCQFVAYCRPTGLWMEKETASSSSSSPSSSPRSSGNRRRGGGGGPGSPTHRLFRSYGKLEKNSPFGRLLVRVETDRSKWPSPSSSSSSSSSSDSSASSSTVSARSGTGRSSSGSGQRRWAYLSVGDCAGKHKVKNKSRVESTFNPGHCHADPINAAYVMEVVERHYRSSSSYSSSYSSTTKTTTPKLASRLGRSHLADDSTAMNSDNNSSKKDRDNNDGRPNWTALLLHAHHYFDDNVRLAPAAPAPAAAVIAPAVAVAVETPVEVPAAERAQAALFNRKEEEEEEEALLADRWPVYAVWHALFKGRVLTRERFFRGASGVGGGGSGGNGDGGGKKSNGGNGDRHIGAFDLDLAAEAALLAEAPYSSAAVVGGLLFSPGQEISVAALSPNGFTSTWWAHENCRAARKSPLLNHFRRKVGPGLDRLAMVAWETNREGERVLAAADAKHWPPPPPQTTSPLATATVATPTTMMTGDMTKATLADKNEVAPLDWLKRGDLILVVSCCCCCCCCCCDVDVISFFLTKQCLFRSFGSTSQPFQTHRGHKHMIHT